MTISSPPGPRRLPLLGIYPNHLSFLRDPVRHLLHLYHTYGDIVSLAEGTTEYVFAFAPEHNRQILTRPRLFEVGDADKSPLRTYEGSALRRLLANGLNQMNEPRHKQQRVLMKPAFHKARVEGYRDEMVRVIGRQLEGWRIGEVRDMLQEMRHLSASIALYLLLGVDPETEGPMLLAEFERWQGLFFHPLTTLLPVRFRLFPYQQLSTLSEQLEARIQTLIARKRVLGTDDGSALSMLLRAHDEDGSQMTEEELVAQSLTLFVAGHETTANALTWTLFLLSRHPEVWQKVSDELSMLQGAFPTLEQLSPLSYLDAIIKESMRLFPPFFWQLRIAAEPFRLGSYDLPAGTTVAFSALVTHRRPELYPQPSHFRPQRWETLSPSPYEYFPFSAAARMCLGAPFAMLEMRLILAYLLQHYRPMMPPHANVNRTGLVFLTPKGGMPMVLESPQARFVKMPVQGNVLELVILKE